MKFAKRLETVEEYYFSKKLKEVNTLQDQGCEIINMAIGSPDLSPPAKVLEALRSSATEHSDHKYQSYQGLPELREAFSDFYKAHYQVQINPNSEVLPLLGSKEGIMHISMAFVNPNEEILIPSPGYPTYTSVAKIVGAIPRYYYLKESEGWLPNIELLERKDLSKVKMMWLNYPHMPTGAKINMRLIERLVKFAKHHDILLINDNPYSFILNESPLSILSADGSKDNCLELNSLSKTFNMSGWRVGAVFGKKEFVDAILKIKSNMDSGMFYGIQKGAIKALKSPREWFEEMNAIYQDRKNMIFHLADKLRCTYQEDTCGMFVWAKLPKNISDADKLVDEILYDKHIFIAPGSIFGKEYKNYIRFSLCVSNQKIEQAIQRF